MTDHHPDAVLITELGGAAQLARRLGLTGKHATQQVSNWKKRGIPEIWRLRRPDVFGQPEAPAVDAEAEKAAA